MSIEVKNLVKSFDDKTVINDISFKVDDGEVLAIVGFSGSGKSTVLKLICGLIPYDNGEVITVPADYVTNGADIPRFFWRLFPPYSPEYFPAVVVHDYLCDIAENANNSKELYKKADIVFKECLTALGVNRLKILLFYNAVRLHHRLKC